MHARHVIAGFIALCFRLSSSLPTLSFSIDLQLPPVAVVGNSFSFNFAKTTFVSSLDIDYSAIDLPRWLHFEPSNRKFSGTPLEEDVGTVSFKLQATDLEGITTTQVNLLVIQQSLLEVDQSSLVTQLEKTGSCSAPSTLLLYPQTYFEINFGSNAFRYNTTKLDFHVVADGSVPLPAWVNFNEENVRLSGTTPSLLTPQSSPQKFDFSLLASEFQGFSQSRFDFQISVTNHILAFLNPTQQLNVSANEVVSIPKLLDQLRYDSQPVSKTELLKVSASQPNWLHFEPEDLSFYGTVPWNATGTSVSVAAGGQSNTVANVIVQVFVPASAVVESEELDLGISKTVVGQPFVYTFDRTDTDATDPRIQLEANLGAAVSWLSFTPGNQSVSGIAPIDAANHTSTISVSVKLNGQLIRTLRLSITVSEAGSNGDNTDTTMTASSHPTSTASLKPATSSDAQWKVALSIVLPLLAVILLCLLGFFLLRRAQRRRLRTTTESTPVTESVQSSGSGNIVVLAQSSSQTERDWDRSFITDPRANSPRRIRPSSIGVIDYDSPETRSSWDNILLSTGSLSSNDPNRDQRIRGLGSDVGNSVDNVSHDSFQKRQRPGDSQHKDLQRPSAHVCLSNKEINGIGHGTNMPVLRTNSQQITMRQVPLSPLSEANLSVSKKLRSGMVNDLSKQGACGGPSVLNVTAPGASAHQQEAYRTTSPTSIDSGHNYFGEVEIARTPLHRRKGTLSSAFAGSIWTDNDWTTEDSVSRSSNWHTRRSPEASRRPLEQEELLHVEDRVTRWTDDRRSQRLGNASNGTSVQSKYSQQSQPHSLRFI